MPILLMPLFVVYYEYKIASHKGFCVLKKNILKTMMIVFCSLSSGVQAVSWPFQKSKTYDPEVAAFVGLFEELKSSWNSQKKDFNREWKYYQRQHQYQKIKDGFSNAFNTAFTCTPIFNGNVFRIVKQGLPVIGVCVAIEGMSWWLEKQSGGHGQITHNHRTDPLVVFSAVGCAMVVVAAAYVAYNYYGDDQPSEKPKKLEKKQTVLKK